MTTLAGDGSSGGDALVCSSLAKHMSRTISTSPASFKSMPANIPGNSCSGYGGGRGKYNYVPGDVPSVFGGQRREKVDADSSCASMTNKNCETEKSDKGLDATTQWERTWRIFTKNCRGLKTDDRIEEILCELRVSDVDWDAIMLTETWREEVRELWHTAEGHVYFGSGRAQGCKGFGILLNSRWKSKIRSTVVENERLLVS